MNDIQAINWDYLSDLDWMIFVGCVIAVTALTIAGVLLHAREQTIVRLMDALDELREDNIIEGEENLGRLYFVSGTPGDLKRGYVDEIK